MSSRKGALQWVFKRENKVLGRDSLGTGCHKAETRLFGEYNPLGMCHPDLNCRASEPAFAAFAEATAPMERSHSTPCTFAWILKSDPQPQPMNSRSSVLTQAPNGNPNGKIAATAIWRTSTFLIKDDWIPF